MSEGGTKYALFVLDGARPSWTSEGQPVCSYAGCNAFDGQVCRYRGFPVRPALHCEPAVIELARRANGSADRDRALVRAAILCVLPDDECTDGDADTIIAEVDEAIRAKNGAGL